MKDNQAKYPQLRFKGFTDPWEQRKLGDLVDSYNKIVSGKSNYPVATSSRRGLFLQSNYFDGSRSGIDENVDFHKVPEKYITYRHMSDDSIFKFNQNDFDTPVLVSKEYPVFRSNQQANQKFLLDHLNNSPEFLKFSTLQKLGGTRVRLYFKNLQAYKLMTPNIEEQNAIASFFTTVDNLIAANQRKLDLLKEQKKGYLQKMFPKNGAKVPELRFAGFADDWEERKLQEVLRERNNQQPQSMEYPLVSFTVENGVTPKTDRYEREQLVVGDKSSKKYKVTVLNDIVYNPANLKFGAISRNKYGNAVFSPIYITFLVNNDVTTPEFIEMFVTRNDFIKRALKYQQGTVYERQSVSPTDLLAMNVYLPGKSEQEKIGSFFQQLDETIALHQRKLDLLKEQKKGFLQKMFV